MRRQRTRGLRPFGFALAVVALTAAPALPASAARGIGFGTPVVALPRCDSSGRTLGLSFGADTCYEPTVAVDQKGRIFVTDGFGEALAVSGDGGHRFAVLPAPPAPTGDVELLGDAIVQTDPRGRLVFSNIYTSGIQVAISSTGGRTWDSNVLVGAGPVSLAPAPDRQWVAFGPRGAVYVVWHTPATPAVWSATSHDGGRSFSPPEPFLGATDVFDMGPPVVDRAGRVYVPVILGSPLSPSAVAVAVSPSGVGTGSFVLQQVSAELSDFFPIAAVSRRGRVAVAWRGSADDGRRVVHVASSRDRGHTWSPPVAWSTSNATSSPWIDFRDDRAIDVMWFGVVSPGATARLVLSRGPAAGRPATSGVVDEVPASPGSRSEANTDYAHFAKLKDGRVVAVWCDSVVWLAVEAR